jgi:outer membrane protein OmpA-like peptidoglycan-associated protein
MESEELMPNNRTQLLATLLTMCFLVCASAFSAADDKVQGTIISRTGETLIVSGADGKSTILLTDETSTVDNKGLFGLDKEHLSSVVLIPGLKVTVFGQSGAGGQFAARKIIVDGDDLETAEMIQSGLHPTAEQVEKNVATLEAHNKHLASHGEQLAAQKEDITTNQQNIGANKQQIAANMKDIEENTNRFMQLSEYDVKGQATVKFKVGSSNISEEDLQQLKQLAETATGLKGYIVEVVGYADATGSAVVNEKLSENRAKAVVSYLVQQCNVPVRHVVAPGAMGEYQPASSNETKEGRADNRRVEVKILVNKGIVGS